MIGITLTLPKCPPCQGEGIWARQGTLDPLLALAGYQAVYYFWFGQG